MSSANISNDFFMENIEINATKEELGDFISLRSNPTKDGEFDAIEIQGVAVKVIKNNLEKTRLSTNATVFRNDYFSFLAATNEKFDIIFLDPPYRQNILEKALNTAVNCLSSNGFIICEHPMDIPLPEFVGNLKATKTTRYGKICITIYRKESE